MNTTWDWYWATFSWAGVGFAFLISYIVLTVGFFLSSLAMRARRNKRKIQPPLTTNTGFLLMATRIRRIEVGFILVGLLGLGAIVNILTILDRHCQR